MRYGSVCSGIEAASVAWHPLGWEAAWLAEIEPFPSAVLGHHYPSVPNYGDMTALADRVNNLEIEAPDVLVGGTPCQAFSVAGLRQSLDDDRGQLTIKFLELADAIDTVRRNRGEPECIIVWENVPGVLSTKDNALGCFLAELAGESEPLQPAGKRWSDAGCVYGSKRAIAWRVLDAQYFGLAQRRRRVFVVASARNGFDPAAVLFEFEGVRRDTAPSRESGKAVAPTIAGCANGGGLGTDFDCDGGVIQQSIAFEPGLLKREGTHFYHEHTGTIRSDPGDNAMAVASVVFHESLQSASTENLSPALGAMNPTAVLQPVCVTGDRTHALKAEGFDGSEDGTGRGHPIIAFPANLSATQHASAENIAPAMGAKNPTAVAMQAGKQHGVGTAMQVRRLTPVECERLQGFPDNYTAIPWRKKPADECSDGSRYKALGNSMAVPVMAWIGSRIDQETRLRETK